MSVTDTGSGIPAERLGAIFDDFVTTKKRGLGLGLAITKRIVEQLDGTITVASEVGKGTTFTHALPRRAAPGRRRGRGRLAEPPRSAEEAKHVHATARQDGSD